MAAIRWASPAEIARQMDAAGEPAPTGDSESGGSLLRQAVARRDTQLLAKPADYVLKNPRVAELYQAMTDPVPLPTDAAAPAAASPEESRAATEAYANATLAEQERLGVVAAAAGVQPGSIRLRKGWHDPETDLGLGEIHIRESHGQHIEGDVADFVADVAASFNEMRRGNADRIILVRRDAAKTRKKDYQDVLIVELQPRKSGGYDIITAGAFKNNYLSNRVLLWRMQ